MPKKEDIQHSLLIVSGSEQFSDVVRRSLPVKRFFSVDVLKSASAARRSLLEKYYNIAVLNLPLPDEMGVDFAMDIAGSSNISVLAAVPGEIFDDVLEHVTDQGIVVISKPIPRGRIGKAIRLLVSFQDRLRRLEREVDSAHEKMEELRIVSRAKLLLVEKNHMTEAEAHRYIGKQAMDSGLSKRRTAERLIEDLE